MGFLSDKPYTAITSNIDRLVKSEYEEDDVSELPDLMEIVVLRPDGPTEAARAIRKKLKYGSPHEQLRALTLLDAFVENGGKKFLPLYRDEMLLERIRVTASGSVPVDGKVKLKAHNLCIGWHNSFKNTPGYEKLSALSKQLPLRVKKERPTPRYLQNDDGYSDEDQDEEDHEPRVSSSRRIHSRNGSASHSRSASASLNDGRHSRTASGSGFKAPKENKIKSSRSRQAKSRGSGTPPELPRLNMMIEKPKIKQTLADSATAAINLKNALQLINPDRELPTENQQATESFDRCRKLRRRVLRYIHSVEGDELLGPLIHANEELVAALKLYDQKTREDSDSDWRSQPSDEEPDITHTTHRVGNMNIHDHQYDNESDDASVDRSESDYEAEPVPIKKRPPPPISPKPVGLRSPRAAVPDDDEDDDPFADSNQVKSKPSVKPMW